MLFERQRRLRVPPSHRPKVRSSGVPAWLPWPRHLSFWMRQTAWSVISTGEDRDCRLPAKVLSTARAMPSSEVPVTLDLAAMDAALVPLTARGCWACLDGVCHCHGGRQGGGFSLLVGLLWARHVSADGKCVLRRLGRDDEDATCPADAPSWRCLGYGSPGAARMRAESCAQRRPSRGWHRPRVREWLRGSRVRRFPVPSGLLAPRQVRRLRLRVRSGMGGRGLLGACMSRRLRRAPVLPRRRLPLPAGLHRT